MGDFLASLIRTLVPIIVGALATAALRLGVEIDTTAAVTVVTPLVTGVVYLVARALEEYVSPKFGWLLGLSRTPTYPKQGS
jgi:hypothetical protein